MSFNYIDKSPAIFNIELIEKLIEKITPTLSSNNKTPTFIGNKKQLLKLIEIMEKNYYKNVLEYSFSQNIKKLFTGNEILFITIYYFEKENAFKINIFGKNSINKKYSGVWYYG